MQIQTFCLDLLWIARYCQRTLTRVREVSISNLAFTAAWFSTRLKQEITVSELGLTARCSDSTGLLVTSTSESNPCL